MFSCVLVPGDSSKAKKAVLVSFNHNEMMIRDDSSEANANEKRISIHQLRLELGGNNQSLVFFRSDELNDDVLYAEYSGSVKKELSQIPALASQLNIIKKQTKIFSTHTLIGVLLFSLVFGSLIYWRGPIFGGIGAAIPFAVEKKIGDQIFNPKLTVEQKALVDELHTLFGQIKFADSKWDDRFVFHISSGTEPNAYATVGGHIFITKGLISELNSVEQLLGVVGHEMIHVKHRHVVRSMAQAVGLFGVVQLVLGDFTGVAAILVDQGGPLLNLQYSRSLEEEADREAMLVLSQNSVDPMGLPLALEIIVNQQKKLMAQTPGGEIMDKLQRIEILSSHPDPKARVEALQKNASELRQQFKVQPVTFDFLKFQKQIKERF